MDDLIQLREAAQPLIDQIYYGPTLFAQTMKKDMDQAVYFFGSTLALLCCFALKQIKGEGAKKTFSMVCGMSIHFFVFGVWAWVSFAQNLLCYLMMLFWPRGSQHQAVFVTSAACLTLSQLYKQFYMPGENGLDVFMFLMMNFCKVSSLVCSAADGEKIKRHGAEKANLKKRELEFANEEGMPCFRDYWSYLFFCGGSISGPWFEFRDFQDYMRGLKHYKDIPSTVGPAMRRIFDFACVLVFMSVMQAYFDEKYMTTDEFAGLSVPMKFVYMLGVMLLRCAIYIIGFCLMESGPIACGLGFNGYDAQGKPKHDRVRCVDIGGLVFAHRVKDFLACWNMSVHHWLKYYVFMRQLRNDKKGGTTQAAFVTFIVSGIWHGFYPGYLSFFFGAFLMDYSNKVSVAVVGPLFAGWCPDVVQNYSIELFYYLCCSYFSVGFFLQYYETTNRVYADLNYCVHWLLISTNILFTILQPKRKRREATKAE